MHRIVSRLGAARSSLVLATVLGLSSLVMMAATAPTASAATRLYYQRGYYLQAGWMCYGWANGAYHCTHHWSRTSDGHLVSHNVKWVPNALDGASTSTRAVIHSPAIHNQAPAKPRTSYPSGGASNPGTGSITGEILAVFGPYGQSALAVARCESGLNPGAVNASSGASGLFQFLRSTWRSTWAGTSYRYASPFNADAHIRAAHEVFVRDGYGWREWVCQP
jgi:hypothetical protein